jgi:hypothetical protein
MSLFGNNLNISTFFLNYVDVVTEKIPEYVKDFDYKTNAVWAYNGASIYMTGFYDDARVFVIEHHNVLLITIHMCLFIELLLKRSRLVSGHLSLREEAERESNLISVTKMRFKEKEHLLKCFQRKYLTQRELHHSVDEIVTHCTEVVEEVKKLQENHSNLVDSQVVIFMKKINDIEEIMIDGSYNDLEYLKYDGEEWTMDLLKEKAIQMEIPSVKWGSKAAIGFVLRTVEQLIKIGEIVEPLYPDGYETQDMEEDIYSSDPEWFPEGDDE